MMQGDTLQNVLSGLNTGRSKRAFNQFTFDPLTAYVQLDAAYQSSWIARRIVEVPAKDMTRNWRTIKSDGAEGITREEDRLNVRSAVTLVNIWANLYGGGGLLLVTDQDLSQPLRVDRIRRGSLQKIIPLDRYDLGATTLNVTDVLADNYLQAEYYSIRNTGFLVHHSHVIRFNGLPLPLRQLQQTQGWGDSKLRICLGDVADIVAAKDGIAELMQEANLDVITKDGLGEALAEDGETGKVIDRYRIFSQMKSIINMALLDGKETLDRHTLNLSGVAPILELFFTWISGCANQPVTKLFGTSAKGLNATGEGDLKTYYDDISADQEAMSRGPMRRFDEVLVRSALGRFPENYDYEWNPLTQPNQLEVAQAEMLQANRHGLYLGENLVRTSQVQRELQAAELYQFDDGEIEEQERIENEAGLNDERDISNQAVRLVEGNERLPELEPEVANDNASFIAQYRSLNKIGLNHDEIMAAVGG